MIFDFFNMYVTPVGDFGFTSNYSENSKYFLTKKEYELLSEHKLKWSITDDVISLVDNDPTEEINNLKLNELRNERIKLLEAFDLWEKAVLRGREADSKVVMQWYQDILDLKEEAFENIPQAIKYYM